MPPQPRENKDIEPTIDDLFDLLEESGPTLRSRLFDLLEAAKGLPGFMGIRIAETLVQNRLIGPANRSRERVAQIRKHDDYEGRSPVSATEQFCQLLHAQLASSGLASNIRGQLGANHRRVIDQVWHLRQLADMARCRYEDWIPTLVTLVADLLDGEAEVEAVDLVRYAQTFGSKLAA